jgi:hypothetical protein
MDDDELDSNWHGGFNAIMYINEAMMTWAEDIKRCRRLRRGEDGVRGVSYQKALRPTQPRRVLHPSLLLQSDASTVDDDDDEAEPQQSKRNRPKQVKAQAHAAGLEQSKKRQCRPKKITLEAKKDDEEEQPKRKRGRPKLQTIPTASESQP